MVQIGINFLAYFLIKLEKIKRKGTCNSKINKYYLHVTQGAPKSCKL